eukprot:5851745-Ditylum_brightwellii.AAC.1
MPETLIAAHKGPQKGGRGCKVKHKVEESYYNWRQSPQHRHKDGSQHKFFKYHGYFRYNTEECNITVACNKGCTCYECKKGYHD